MNVGIRSNVRQRCQRSLTRPRRALHKKLLHSVHAWSDVKQLFSLQLFLPRGVF